MSFDRDRALRNWQREHPDREERIHVLRRELASCRGTVRDWRGHRRARKYPRTEAAIGEMLAVLEGS